MKIKITTRQPKWFPKSITIDLFLILIGMIAVIGLGMVLVPHQISDFTIRLLGGLFLLFVYLSVYNRIKLNKNSKATETTAIDKI